MNITKGKGFIPRTEEQREEACARIMESIKSKDEILDTPVYFSFVGMDYHIEPTLITELTTMGGNDSLAFFGISNSGGVAFIDRDNFFKLCGNTEEESWASMAKQLFSLTFGTANITDSIRKKSLNAFIELNPDKILKNGLDHYKTKIGIKD